MGLFEEYPNPRHKRFLAGGGKKNPQKVKSNHKVHTTLMYTPFWRAGAGGKKGEEKLESQDRVVLSHAAGGPLIYPGPCDVTDANGGGSGDTLEHL